jgi:predicted transcriptional regulator
MDDDELHRRIDELVAEEHRLERAHVGQALSDAEQQRLTELGVQLDRYWDLLRQRDARRRAGLDPDAAQERSADVVEGYRQ